MSSLKTIAAIVPVALILGGCVGNDPVDTTAEIEATTDQDIDGDGLIVDNGVTTTASN
ncbi:MAG: hypothetical protein WBA67_15560 [Jannaschia sp.]